LGAAGIYFITNESAGKGTLFLYDFETRKILSLMPFEKRVVEPTLSSDGRFLVFFQIDQWEKSIMLVDNFR
jgi:Tol biopolymer transport system component